MKVGDLVRVEFYGFEEVYHGLLLSFHPHYRRSDGEWRILFNDGDIMFADEASFHPDAKEMVVEVLSESR